MKLRLSLFQGSTGPLRAMTDWKGQRKTGRAAIMADSQGPKETMTGKGRGYPMHTVSVPILSPSIVLRHCYPFRQNWIQKQSFPPFHTKILGIIIPIGYGKLFPLPVFLFWMMDCCYFGVNVARCPCRAGRVANEVRPLIANVGTVTPQIGVG